MAKAMKAVTGILLVFTGVFACLYHLLHWNALLSAAITCGTSSYHFVVRILVGALFDRCNPRHDPSKRWYRLHPWEEALYRKLNVRAWKHKLPTYSPDSFSPKQHTWEEIVQATCRSELVHETNCVLSFGPVTAAVWFGTLPVFLITSILGAGFDLLFVIVQRYNRQRMKKLALKQRQRPRKEVISK